MKPPQQQMEQPPLPRGRPLIRAGMEGEGGREGGREGRWEGQDAESHEGMEMRE